MFKIKSVLFNIDNCLFINKVRMLTLIGFQVRIANNYIDRHGFVHWRLLVIFELISCVKSNTELRIGLSGQNFEIFEAHDNKRQNKMFVIFPIHSAF